MGDLTHNFSRHEFACKCGCGFSVVDHQLVVGLQALRDLLGQPITINSGCRCKAHNSTIPGASDGSTHMTGQGADIKSKTQVEELFLLAKSVPQFTGIGLYATHVHVDVRRRSRRATWDKH